MPKLPDIPHLEAIKAFEKAAFSIVRQRKHVTMTNGERIITIPRHNPINAYTLAAIIRGAGLSIDQFKKLL
ncbi:MAG TPA: type II toxin-antitoxin system HicA family toxin [Candidatus Kapabacteria bacterium]|nr:type II toxin-antitoxin system HicA family toxin [Candidatus Kapabacteria bacterium]